MSKTDTFFRLSKLEKIILIKALILLWIVRIMLWALPFQTLQTIIKKLNSTEENKIHSVHIEKLIWAVEVMSAYTLCATCLTRALAAQILLAKYNYSSNIKIGVSKNKGEFEAHAWLESEDITILGKCGTEYVPILKIDGKFNKKHN